MKNKIINIILWILSIIIYYYFALPPINLQNISFWILIIYILITGSIFIGLSNILQKRPKLSKTSSIMLLIPLAIILLIGIINIIYSPLFMSKMYSERIDINTEGNWSEDIAEVDFSKIPLLDKASSQKLGDRVMGQMPEMVSQFYVSDLYTQINYQNKIIRVTPLEYNGFFKYINNRKEGIKGYIEVNSTTGEAKLTKLDKGIKYTESALFQEDLYRHLRFNYPFDNFGNGNFEIDEEGNPYWVFPIIKYKGIGLSSEITGIVLLDPITGKTKKHELKEIPSWVDHVFSASLILEQVDDWGSYKDGYLNSIFSQKNVVMTTDGYNYLAMNDDVYLYTGITSVSSDEANVGFILTNMRTKETIFYSVAGAEEYSAMESAKGQVQQMNYTPTFPLLINLNGKPTYLISLKDNAGLVKMYAFVDVLDYQKVTVEDSSLGIDKVASIFLGEDYISNSKENITTEIKISNINMAVIDGISYYYIIDTNNKKYKASIKINKDLLPFIKENDIVKITYKEQTEITDILKIEKK